MKLLVLILLTAMAHAQEWKRSKEEFNFIDGNLTFSNRASCALKAKLPTRSVFLLVDNVNIAKAAFRLTKINGSDPVETTDLAVNKFRYTITKLVSIISSKLIEGKLPLIEDANVSHANLQRNWENSGQINNQLAMHCRAVNKLGSLYSYLNISRPDHLLFEKMAKEMEKIEETFTSCDEISKKRSQEVALFQFDVPDNKEFDKYGFRFWYSLKVYLSWAFRYSKEMTELAAPFDFLFRSSDLEEMILFASAGCKSMSAPECTDVDLNLQTLGDLTVPADQFDFFGSDRIIPVSQARVEQFFSKPLPLKDSDLLHLSSFPSSEEWVRNFRENFIKTRGFQKLRLSSSLVNLNVIQSILTSDELKAKIQLESENQSEEWKKDFFYLCSEYGIATNKHFTNLRKDLGYLIQNGAISDITKDLALDDIVIARELFEKIHPEIKELCNNLVSKQFWNEITIDKNGYAPWYLQLTRTDPLQYNLRQQLTGLSEKNSYIKINGQEVFCKSGVHCARILLDSLFTLTSVSRSLSTIYPKEINSANLGNPYASHLACGAYDPWAKRNKMIFEFFHDLTQAAVFGALPTPVYVSADVKEKKLTSFAELMKDGKIYYDPQFSPRSVSLSLIADLGPLIGIPCAVSVSGLPVNPVEYYMFSGISFSGCLERTRNDISVSVDENINSSSSYRQACGSCAINLKTIGASLSSVNPLFRFSAFLIKGVVRLAKNLRDPDDRPKSWIVSPQKVSMSYRYWGGIDKSCARKLRRGNSCLPKACQQKMMEDFTRMYKVSPVSTNFNCLLKRGEVRVKGCDTPIMLSLKENLHVKTSCHLKRRAL